jgi:hypothetical protein
MSPTPHMNPVKQGSLYLLVLDEDPELKKYCINGKVFE